MKTYLIYNFILFGSTISAYMYEKAKSKNYQMIFLFFSFIIPFVFLAIRYNIGTDYPNYVRYFEKIASGMETIKEPGYEVVNRVVAYFGLDVQWVFIFFGFFTFYFAYEAFPKDGFAMSIFLFIAIFYLYEGYSAIRQGLAVAIMAYAMRYIYEKNFLKYLMFSLLAMSFHLISGFILLIVYPIVNKNINKYILIILIIILSYIVFRTNLHIIIMNGIVSLFPKYAWYLNSKYMQASQISSGLGMLLKVLIALTVVFFKDKIVAKYPESNIVINLYIFYIIFMLLRTKVMIFGRVEHVFIFAQIFSIMYLLKTFKKGLTRFTVSILMLSIYFIIFIKYINAGTIEKGGNNINPYQTILERS